MTAALPCGLDSQRSCAASEALSVAESLRRLKREAVRGVCDTGRYRCSYFDWGSGPPLVFIPGLLDDSLSFVIPAAHLSRAFRCIAYDTPIGGADKAHLDRYRHEDLVADLLSLLDHLSVKRSYLVGSSFGSTVALAALWRAPDRLPRAVLIGGFAHRPLAPAERLLAAMARYWPGPMRRLPFRAALLRQSHFPPFVGREPDCWEFLLERWGATPMAATARRALLLHQIDLRPVLGEIRQPVLLVCGDQDPLVNKKCEQELLRGLPAASRVELSNCGHAPHFSHPGLLAEVVRRFLTPEDAAQVGPTLAASATT
jgi:pimeloyl-ACP methyl ester carboxylesterase